ncbi:hypothetical protein SADUNF_Sadunf01G0029800 [Salix dunnii]|uniref:Uncharacterized protein n=1 Tax=Salix dunnii TaxID=1413687 RepID=A0A835N9Z0_9ROSI|nr:hypothetical protein SADUNF_Sadunf01G0029800 [Salix dunnii]
MVLDSMITSPHRRSPSFRKQFPRDELGSWSTLLQRHRFLLTALALLAFLCTIYLYFAVTLGATESCSGLTGNRHQAGSDSLLTLQTFVRFKETCAKIDLQKLNGYEGMMFGLCEGWLGFTYTPDVFTGTLA